jgi:type I restriction enzyme, S subunit
MSEPAKKPGLVPKLRFPEFLGGGSWNDIPIASILNFRDERRLPGADAPLYSLTIENGVTAKTDRYNREFLVRDSGNKKYKLVEPNDIVFNPSNLRWGAINYSQLTHSVVVSPIYEVLSLRDSAANFLEFIACSVMRGEQIRRFIIKGQGTLVERIAVKVEDFLSTNLPVPPTRAEQQKIAECLSSVDELMASQARKVDALKTHKKGLIQQLFPREGETQPRLRFPEFQNAGEWEKSPLSGFILSLDSGVSVNSGDSRPANETEFGVLKTSAITKGQFDPNENKVVLSESELSRLKEPVTGGTIIMCRKNTPALVGANSYVESGRENLFLPDLLWAAKPREGVSMRFLACILGSEKGRAALSKLAKGSSASMSNITKPEVLAFSVMAPLPVEQERIASCLSSLDALITAESQKLDALKTHKKGLMQQLFPAPEAVEA